MNGATNGFTNTGLTNNPLWNSGHIAETPSAPPASEMDTIPDSTSTPLTHPPTDTATVANNVSTATDQILHSSTSDSVADQSEAGSDATTETFSFDNFDFFMAPPSMADASAKNEADMHKENFKDHVNNGYVLMQGPAGPMLKRASEAVVTPSNSQAAGAQLGRETFSAIKAAVDNRTFVKSASDSNGTPVFKFLYGITRENRTTLEALFKEKHPNCRFEIMSEEESNDIINTFTVVFKAMDDHLLGLEQTAAEKAAEEKKEAKELERHMHSGTITHHESTSEFFEERLISNLTNAIFNKMSEHSKELRNEEMDKDIAKETTVKNSINKSFDHTVTTLSQKHPFNLGIKA